MKEYSGRSGGLPHPMHARTHARTKQKDNHNVHTFSPHPMAAVMARAMAATRPKSLSSCANGDDGAPSPISLNASSQLSGASTAALRNTTASRYRPAPMFRMATLRWSMAAS
ncbi:Putative peptidoglycan binding domain [Musa troglodytarum]|uniref:Peptidoglycan binding domain n=1 Tax=Musa troglodytarum TaxID=320322 RepID=A0A9E7ENN9_9LILI|nr:Putative peptidoglycan binding domain [Musa troglodytarum]